MSYILRPTAKADILRIAKYIADRNPQASLDWYDEILATCSMLGEMPEAGHARGDVRRGVRTFPKGNCLIVYRVDGRFAAILRAVHSARDWPKLLR